MKNKMIYKYINYHPKLVPKPITKHSLPFRYSKNDIPSFRIVVQYHVDCSSAYYVESLYQ